MASIQEMIPHIKRWEGGYANDPSDKGGCTMMGVTIATFRSTFGKNKTCEDLKNITEEQWLKIFQKYTKPWHVEDIQNQSIALLCVDMGYMSGVKTAIKKVQAALGLKADGIVGPITLAALNHKYTANTFSRLYAMRYKWLQEIAKKGNNSKFLRGWLNRLNAIRYRP